MSKKVKGKLCVYCGKAEATTADHVLCREFFLKDQRANLPKVPACARCNSEKAELEHYLTVVLAFGGRHKDAAGNLSMVPKRLLKNAKLHRELAAGFDGETIPFDPSRLEKLFAMIARGLAWYHWQVLLGDAHSATASIFNDAGKAFFDQALSKWNTPRRVTGNLGDGTFSYEGAQATDCPEATIWKFSMYGAVVFGGDPNVPGPASLTIAVTGPADFIQRLQSGLARETGGEVK